MADDLEALAELMQKADSSQAADLAERMVAAMEAQLRNNDRLHAQLDEIREGIAEYAEDMHKAMAEKKYFTVHKEDDGPFAAKAREQREDPAPHPFAESVVWNSWWRRPRR
jgi:hypothetical protein